MGIDSSYELISYKQVEMAEGEEVVSVLTSERAGKEEKLKGMVVDIPRCRWPSYKSEPIWFY